MTTITPERIADLRAMEAKATPGPWHAEIDEHYGSHPRIYADGRLIAAIGNVEVERQDYWEADAKMAVAARNALIPALDEIDRLRCELDEARALIAAADKGHPIHKAVERILDEHSAWIARPNDEVTKAIALAAGVAWMAAAKVDPSLDEIDRALSMARDENERLREALRFYANCLGDPNEGPWGVKSTDFGRRAMEALKEPGHE